MTTSRSDDIHSCSYFCERPECIKRQRDELRDVRLRAERAEIEALRELLRMAREERDLVERLRDVVPEHGWAVVNTQTGGTVISFSERREFHTERKARAWLQEHAETHRSHEVQPYEDRCLEHEAAAEIERLREHLRAVLSSGVGRQTLLQLADGQGTATADGRAWLAAARALGPNVRAEPPP